MLSIDELAGCSHAGSWHHRHTLHAAEALAHAGREVSVLRVWGCFFEGAELVLALVFFLFATVAAVGTF